MKLLNILPTKKADVLECTLTESKLDGQSNANSATTNSALDDNITADLAMRIGSAISEWATLNHLEEIPKDILLDQVIDIVQTMKGVL